MKIRWQDKVPDTNTKASDTEVLKMADMQSVHTLVKLVQLHVYDGLAIKQSCLMSDYKK